MCSRLARVPQTVVDMVRSGRLTALTKPDGGVRGIVAGDVIRRRWLRPWSEPPHHQYALSTRAGCRPCVAGVFDISREAMLRGLRQAHGIPLRVHVPRVSFGVLVGRQRGDGPPNPTGRRWRARGCVDAALVRTRST